MSLDHVESAARYHQVPRLEADLALRHLRGEHEITEPVIFDGLGADWPAIRYWTPDYLRDRCGRNRVKVFNSDYGRPGPRYMSHVEEMTLSEYLDILEAGPSDRRLFLLNLSGEFRVLRDDLPSDLLADDISRRLLFMFFGGSGSVTPMHYDIDNSEVFHTQVRGRKRVFLFDQQQSTRLYRHPFTVRSYVDVPEPDIERFPASGDLFGYEAEIRPGDTLFIPSGFWHQFRYPESGYGFALRRAHRSKIRRVQGVAMIASSTIVDRGMNKLSPERWFAWKARRADSKARQTIDLR